MLEPRSVEQLLSLLDQLVSLRDISSLDQLFSLSSLEELLYQKLSSLEQQLRQQAQLLFFWADLYVDHELALEQLL